MISIKDVQGAEHKVCPRCGGKWKYIANNDSYAVCLGDKEKCGMMACRQNENEFFLTVEVGKYTLYWHNSGTMVDITFTGEFEEIESTQLPTLPFDISLDKLKTYLVFG